MRQIRKGLEPKSLAEYRSSSGAYFDGYPDKDDLRTVLAAEQRGICCYCMSRIHADRERMKIEHWQSRAKYPSRQLDYSNLLGACPGKAGHCDASKGDQDLSKNPTDPLHAVETTLRFLGDGRIESSDPAFNRELEQVLKLNHPVLVRNRKSTLDSFQRALPKTGAISAAKLENWLRRWSGDSGPGELEPYCQVVVYWLQKRLARTKI